MKPVIIKSVKAALHMSSHRQTPGCEMADFARMFVTESRERADALILNAQRTLSPDYRTCEMEV